MATMSQVEGPPATHDGKSKHLLRRAMATKFFELVPFPNETLVRYDAIKQAEEFVKNGYSMLYLYTHGAKDDQIRFLSALWTRSTILRKLDTYTPVAWHVRKETKFMTDMFGIKMRSIVTQDTVDKGLNYDDNGKKIPLHYGEKDYVIEGRDELRNGGSVLVAPQQGRRNSLEWTDKKPVEFLLHGLDENQKVAIMFVGLGFVNEKNYDRDFTGLNPFRKFLIKIGPTITREELSQNAKKENMTMDQYVLLQLGENVPTPYNKL